MSCIYYVRHGQSETNARDVICGAMNAQLTEQGHEQAREIARRILAAGLHIDEIVHSPLDRARATARHISEAIGAPMREDPRFKEQNFGRLQGQSRLESDYYQVVQHLADSMGGGESMLRVGQRVFNALDDLRRLADADGKTRLVVAHNGILRLVEAYFRDLTNEEFSRLDLENCEIRRYDFP